MNRHRLSLLLACFLFGASGPVWADPHALIVAVAEYSAEEFAPDLPACRDDARAMKSWLMDEFGFPAGNITELSDREATTPAIRKELERLVAVVEPGDPVVIYYSGHGSQVADFDGDETEDGLDELLVTYDFAQSVVNQRQDPAAWLTDDVIREALTRLRTNRVLVMFDCCHSGTATRNWLNPHGMPRAAEVKWFPGGFGWKARPGGAGAGKPGTLHHSGNANHLYVAACRSDEEAIAVGEGGLLTLAWTGIASGKGNVTLRDLGERIVGEVSGRAADLKRRHTWIKTTQTPQFEGNLTWTMTDLLGPEVSPKARELALALPGAATEPRPGLREKPQQWGDIGVSVATDRGQYNEGDPMTVTVTSERDGYVQLFLIDAEGNTTFLFPHDQPGGAKVRTGVPLKVTGPDAANNFEMTAPYGHEIIKAMVSTAPFPAPEVEREDTLRSVGTRGIGKIAKSGSAVTFYQVLPREIVVRSLEIDRPETKEYRAVEVYYATDRKPTGNVEPSQYYGARRNRGSQPVQYGTALVTIPKTHRIGVVERPQWYRAEFWQDPRKHVTMQSPKPLDPGTFFEQLNKDSRAGDKRQALLFVHGFNVTFYDAVRRVGQIAADLDFPGVPMTYSWPSYGRLEDYLPDETNANWSEPQLASVLLDLQNRGELDQVHVIAHSMGARVFSNALAEARNRGFTLKLNNVILAAPDIDSEIFVDHILPRVREGAARFTLYASADDRALQTSQQLKQNPRLGLSGDSLVVAAGLDTVDATGIDTDVVSHSYYGNNTPVFRDIRDLLQGLDPRSRGLREGRRGEWVIGK